MAWPRRHVGDMEEYLIVLGNIPPRYQNTYDNIFSNVDKIY
jgi:hypothetical protein